jgi:hypothetical protein
LRAAFDPTGTLLVSNGWDHQLRLRDSVLGRPALSISGDCRYHVQFSQDGRIALSRLAERRPRVLAGVWSDHVLGLALYRAGRFAEADARLHDCVVWNPGWGWQVLNWLVLAMTEERLGRPDEARHWLEQSNRWIASRLEGRPGGVDRAVPENWHWRDGILLHLLHRESHALLRENLPELPAEVFAKPP